LTTAPNSCQQLFQVNPGFEEHLERQRVTTDGLCECPLINRGLWICLNLERPEEEGGIEEDRSVKSLRITSTEGDQIAYAVARY